MSYLILWYGLLQAAHIVVLLVGGYHYIQTGFVGFPAPGPPEGWSTQAVPFLIGMASFDLLIAIASLVFVYRFFVRKELIKRLGIVVLTSASVSALLFGIGTLPSGAWRTHPATYFSMTVLFIPVFILWFLTIKKS